MAGIEMLVGAAMGKTRDDSIEGKPALQLLGPQAAAGRRLVIGPAG